LRRLRDVVGASKGLGRLVVILSLYRRWARGDLVLVDPEPPRSFTGYLASPAYSTWYWLSVAVVACSLASSLTAAPIPLRLVFDPLAVLFIPGLMLVELLYPVEESMKPIGRAALSIAFSMVVSSAAASILGYPAPLLPGITPASLPALLLAYTVLVGLAAEYRKYRSLAPA